MLGPAHGERACLSPSRVSARKRVGLCPPEVSLAGETNQETWSAGLPGGGGLGLGMWVSEIKSYWFRAEAVTAMSGVPVQIAQHRVPLFLLRTLLPVGRASLTDLSKPPGLSPPQLSSVKPWEFCKG